MGVGAGATVATVTGTGTGAGLNTSGTTTGAEIAGADITSVSTSLPGTPDTNGASVGAGAGAYTLDRVGVFKVTAVVDIFDGVASVARNGALSGQHQTFPVFPARVLQ